MDSLRNQGFFESPYDKMAFVSSFQKPADRIVNVELSDEESDFDEKVIYSDDETVYVEQADCLEQADYILIESEVNDFTVEEMVEIVQKKKKKRKSELLLKKKIEEDQLREDKLIEIEIPPNIETRSNSPSFTSNLKPQRSMGKNVQTLALSLLATSTIRDSDRQKNWRDLREREVTKEGEIS